jgi:hypothetical protein
LEKKVIDHKVRIFRSDADGLSSLDDDLLSALFISDEAEKLGRRVKTYYGLMR